MRSQCNAHGDWRADGGQVGGALLQQITQLSAYTTYRLYTADMNSAFSAMLGSGLYCTAWVLTTVAATQESNLLRGVCAY
jgi:hypothetical protein